MLSLPIIMIPNIDNLLKNQLLIIIQSNYPSKVRMIVATQRIIVLMLSFKGKYSQMHFSGKPSSIIRQYYLQSILRQCTSLSEIRNVIYSHQQQFIKDGKTILLQFLNEFYIDAKFRRMERPTEVYGFLQKLTQLNFYELTIKSSIYKKIAVYHQNNPHVQRLQENSKKQVIMHLKNNVQKKQNKIDFIDAFNVLIASDYDTDISIPLKIIDDQILIVGPKIRMFRIYYMIYKRLFSTHGWIKMRKYYNICLFLSDNFIYYDIATLSVGVDFSNSLTLMKLHLVGPRAMSYHHEGIMKHFLQQDNYLRLPQKQILLAFQSFKYTPIDYKRQVFYKIYEFISKKAFLTTFYLSLIPYNKLNQRQIQTIQNKIIDNQSQKIWEDGVYFFNKPNINKNMFNNPKMRDFVGKKFKERYQKQKYESVSHITRYLGFGMIIIQNNIIIPGISQTVQQFIFKIYEEFVAHFNNDPKQNKEKKKQVKSLELMFKSTKSVELQTKGRIQILNILNIANTINLLSILLKLGKTAQFQIILSILPAIFKKRKDRIIFNNFIEQFIEASQSYLDRRFFKTKEVDRVILAILIYILTNKEQINFNYSDLINGRKKSWQLNKIRQQLQFNINNFSMTIFMNCRKGLSNNDQMQQLSNIVLNQLKPNDQIVLIQLYLLYENKNFTQTTNFINLMLIKRKTNLKNALLLLGGLPISQLRSDQGYIHPAFKQYLKNKNIKDQITLLNNQKKQYLQKMQNFQRNGLNDFEIDIVTIYNALNALLIFYNDDEDIHKFVLAIVFFYIQNFDFKFVSQNDYQKAYKFLQMAHQVIKEQLDVPVKDKQIIFYKSLLGKNDTFLKEQIDRNYTFQIQLLTKISQNLNALSLLYRTRANSQNKGINLYPLVKQLQLKSLISYAIPFPQITKQSLLTEIINELKNNYKQQQRSELSLILIKLYIFGLIKINKNDLTILFSHVEYSIVRQQLSSIKVASCLSYFPTYFTNNIINKHQYEFYMLPIIKTLLDQEKPLLNNLQKYFYFIEVILKLSSVEDLNHQHLKIYHQSITKIFLNIMLSSISKFQLKSIMKMMIKTRNQQLSILNQIKKCLDLNPTYRKGLEFDIYVFLLKIFCQIPEKFKPELKILQNQVSLMVKEGLQVYKKKQQKIQYSRRYIDLIWCSIRTQNIHPLFKDLINLFVVELPRILKTIKFSNQTFSIYAKIYYYGVINHINQRDQKMEEVFQKLMENQIEINSKLEKFLDKKYKYLHKIKLNKNKLSLTVQYYLPQTEEIILVIKPHHQDLSCQNYTGDLQFDYNFYRVSLGRKVKIYNPRLDKFIEFKEINNQLQFKQK